MPSATTGRSRPGAAQAVDAGCYGPAVDSPSQAELDAALRAVAASHPEADVVRLGVAEAWTTDEPGQRLVYLDAKRRDDMGAGDEYTTWVVRFVAGAAVEASFFCSRACSTGGPGTSSE